MLCSCRFSDEGGGAILDDINILSAGYIILILFVVFVIGKCNCVQQRVSDTGLLWQLIHLVNGLM